MLDPLRIVQMAAARIGEEAPTSLAEAAGDDSLELVYQSVTDFCLDLHTWDFTRELRQLPQLAGIASPVLGYPYVFELPTDAIGEPLRVVDDIATPDRAFYGWTLHGARILALASPLYAVVNVRPPPARWPGTFREAVVLAIAAELALSMASNDGLRAELRVNAYGTPSQDFRGGAIGVAIRNQAFRTPAKRLALGTDPLSASWRG
ncbi:hypothetical protein [Ancylobacter terrae]|uniref:hypothetical protein n=1 Tax=Ancylobacter sp. sgz301288 TaxID=3342077 RepID=UPI00385C6CDB